MLIEILKKRRCPCGTGDMYEACCGPLHEGALPESPEALMRSRYTAISVGNMRYINQTCREELASHGEDVDKDIEWLALHVLSAKPKPYGDKAWVEFVAFYGFKGDIGQLHEKSWFELEAGRWIYTRGDIRPDVSWGRNDLCWCGSGKKTKKCHV